MLQHFHYLVKPFSDEKFEEVVKRAVRSIKEYSENQLDEKYMMVQSGGSHMKVFLKDIVYAEYIIEKSLSIHGIRILNIMENCRN